MNTPAHRLIVAVINKRTQQTRWDKGGLPYFHFIALVSSWQSANDEAALSTALDPVEQLCTALDELLDPIPRYANYQRRFRAALDAVDDGDVEALCNPRRDSAHNVWFEFHEDILGVLARQLESG